MLSRIRDWLCDFARSIVARINAIGLFVLGFAAAYPNLPQQLLAYLPDGAAPWLKPALIVGWFLLVQWALRRDRAKVVERVEQARP